MTYAPFRVQAVAARLREQVPSLRKVGLAADYAAIRGLEDFPMPAAYVLLAREDFAAHATGHAERGGVSALAQRAKVNFGVVIAGRNYREERGGQLAEALESLLAAVRQALLGWTPDQPGARPLQLMRGDLLQYSASTALWSDVWQTQSFIGPRSS